MRRGNELEDALSTFVGFRSVSGDESCREECWRCAKFLSALLETHTGASVRLAAGAVCDVYSLYSLLAMTSTSSLLFY